MLRRRIATVRTGRQIDVVLYSKPECELCAKAERAVRSVFGSRHLRIVNILDDRELEDRYIFRIPVLVVDGVEVAEGLIDADDARRARAGAIRQRMAE